VVTDTFVSLHHVSRLKIAHQMSTLDISVRRRPKREEDLVNVHAALMSFLESRLGR
jgi:hypothetical protein